MKESFLQLSIDTKKVILTSESLFFKTENFNELLVEIGWKVISVILIIIIFSI